MQSVLLAVTFAVFYEPVHSYSILFAILDIEINISKGNQMRSRQS